MLRVFFLIFICNPNFIVAQCPFVELGPDTTVCEGNELKLSAGNAGAEYRWSTGETSESIYVYDAGRYSVTVSMNGCTVQDSILVIIVPVLWSDFTFTKISDCLPVKYQFTDMSSSCGGSITDWLWEFGDGTISTEQNPQHEFAGEAQFAVKLTVTDNNGNSIRRSKRVTIVASSISVDLGPDSTICFGSSVTLDAGNPGYTYLWNTGDTSRKIIVMDDGDYSVIVQGGSCLAKDTVSVKTSASVNVIWGYTMQEVCLPVSVQFSDSSKVYCGQTITGWSWNFGDGSTSTLQNPVHEYLSADSFLVKLTITTSNGSTGSRTTGIGIKKNTIYTTDLPAEAKVCSGESVQLDAGVVDAEYTWLPSFGVSETNIRNPSIKPLISTWYSVRVSKCMVDVVDSVYIIVDSIAKPQITQSGNNLQVNEASSYEWYRDGHKLAGANKSSLRMDRQGYYAVKIFNNSGCERLSEPKFFLPKSGKENDKDDLIIKCSPNPTRGQVNIILSALPEKPARLAVYDSHGGMIHRASINDHVNPLNLPKLKTGLYFVEVSVNNRKKIIPVIVQ